MSAANDFTAHRHRGGLVAGFDGSVNARRAIRWAASEAAARGRPLLLVQADLLAAASAWGTVAAPGWGVAAAFEDAYLLREIQSRLDEATRDCRLLARTIDVVSVMANGESSPALFDAARTVDAELLVVGRSSLGLLARILFGTTATDLVRLSDRPVVVVHGDRVNANSPVVVGVDGTDASLPAVRFAFEYAARHGCGLRAVHAVSKDSPDLITSAGPWHDSDDLIVTKGLRDEFLGAWRTRYPAVPVEIDIVEDRPARALLARSKRARLLVVGSRRTTFGSVSHAAVQRASCPVAVVPSTRYVHSHRVDRQ